MKRRSGTNLGRADGMTSGRGFSHDVNTEIGSNGGRWHDMNRDRGTFQRGLDHHIRGRGSFQRRGTFRFEPWPRLLKDKHYKNCIPMKIEDDEEIYMKVKHLFEQKQELSNTRIKSFGFLTLDLALDFLNNQKYSKRNLFRPLIGNDITRQGKYFLEECGEHFAPPTLKDMLTETKINVVNSMRKSLKKINHPDFNKEVPHMYLVVLEEIRMLTGEDVPFSGQDLFPLLSNVGRFIVATRLNEKIRDVHVKAAHFFMKHPDLCPSLRINI